VRGPPELYVPELGTCHGSLLSWGLGRIP
jgi:hypothetical protein